MTAGSSARGPLAGTLVLDVTRMLPGAVLARMLVGFGARVVKIEEPERGDPMRASPPIVDSLGAGFAEFFAGAESVCLDLRSAAGASALRRLARFADVLVESFRPGTLDAWGVGPARLRARNPGLVVCSLSSYGQQDYSSRVGHDLNFVAESGLLAALGGASVPGVQVADVASGLVAGASIVAALFERTRSGRGMHLDQSLAGATEPFLALARAESVAGGGGLSDGLLSGGCPAYGVYECSDGALVALGALEPKFWVSLVDAVGLADLAGDGLDTGERGREATRRLAERFATGSREHWLALAAERGLPLSAVRSVAEALGDPAYGPSSRASRAAPRLGSDTRRVLAEFGFAPDEIALLVE